MRQLDDSQLIIEPRRRERQQHIQRLPCALRGDDGDRKCAAAEMQRGQQSRQAEEMVAMQMRDAYQLHGLQLLPIGAHLVLCALSAVEQQPIAAHIHHLTAAMAHQRGHSGTTTHNGRIEIHRDK